MRCFLPAVIHAGHVMAQEVHHHGEGLTGLADPVRAVHAGEPAGLLSECVTVQFRGLRGRYAILPGLAAQHGDVDAADPRGWRSLPVGVIERMGQRAGGQAVAPVRFHVRAEVPDALLIAALDPGFCRLSVFAHQADRIVINERGVVHPARVRETAVEVADDMEWRNRIQALRPESGHPQLRDARPRRAEHPDMPGAPRLGRRPADDLRSRGPPLVRIGDVADPARTAAAGLIDPQHRKARRQQVASIGSGRLRTVIRPGGVIVVLQRDREPAGRGPAGSGRRPA